MLTSLGNNFCNGGILVTPFTDLQSPDDSSVTVNVYVYSDNLQVNCLTGANMYDKRAAFDGLGLLGESGNISSNTTLDVTTLDLNPSSAENSKVCMEYFGEQPLSFRALLKRYVTTRKYAVVDAATTNRLFQYAINIFPPSQLPYGTSTVAITELFSYLRYAYLGYRGGIRTMVTTNSLPTIGGLAVGKITLLPASTSFTDALTVDVTTYNSCDLEGTIATSSISNPVLHCETPFYSNNLFAYPMTETLDDGLASTEMMEHYWFRSLRVSICVSGSAVIANSKLVVDQAAAEDFSFMRFQGAPYYTTVIA